MKEFSKSRIGKAIISGLSVFIVAIILWPLFDMFWCNVISHKEFSWNVYEHIVEPFLVGLFLTIIEYIWPDKFSGRREQRKNKD